MQGPKVSVALIEDAPGFRKQLSKIIEDQPDWHVVTECVDAVSAFDEIAKLQPDLIILDAHLPGLSGIDSIPRFKASAPNASILMLTVEERPDQIFRSLKAGANGYLIKGGSASVKFSTLLPRDVNEEKLPSL